MGASGKKNLNVCGLVGPRIVFLSEKLEDPSTAPFEPWPPTVVKGLISAQDHFCFSYLRLHVPILCTAVSCVDQIPESR